MNDSAGANAAASAFVDALRATAAVLDGIPAKLEGARVHDFAFGKLFEASEVRDAYHQRLPETEKDLDEAKEVIEHFIAGLDGGHGIAARDLAVAAQIVPGPATASRPQIVPGQATPLEAQAGP